MNNNALETKNLLQQIVVNRAPLIFTATVKSVEGDTCSIIVEDNLLLSNVRLRAVTDPNSRNTLLIKPQTESTVLVADLSNGERRDLVVINVSDIESVIINQGTEPMVKGNALIDQLKKMAGRINGVINALNGAQTFPSTKLEEDDSGALMLSTIKIGLGNIGEKENFSNINNEKIKHWGSDEDQN